MRSHPVSFRKARSACPGPMNTDLASVGEGLAAPFAGVPVFASRNRDDSYCRLTSAGKGMVSAASGRKKASATVAGASGSPIRRANFWPS